MLWNGKKLAVQTSAAPDVPRRRAEIAFENVNLKLEASGANAVVADCSDLGSHEIFWFSWSHFHPGDGIVEPVDGPTWRFLCLLTHHATGLP